MRRKRIRSGRRSSLRKGVTVRVKTMKRMVQSPVKCVMYSIGLAVRFSCHARQASHPSGATHITNIRALIDRLRSIVRSSSSGPCPRTSAPPGRHSR
jgi:hypothetical protein